MHYDWFSIFDIDVRTLLVVLFLGNLVSVAVVGAYRFSNYDDKASRLPNQFLVAKLFQGIAYFLLYHRGQAPDLISVNLGNTLLLTGFCLEGLSIFVFIGKQAADSWVRRWIIGLLIFSLFLFNTIEFWHPHTSLRVAIASVCAFIIFCIPVAKFLVQPRLSRFKRVVSIFYFIFLCMLLPRAVYAVMHPIGILSNVHIQAFTFLSLVMLLIFSLPAFLLVMKENDDKLIQLMVTTDYLTGLSNRYHFMGLATRMFDRHKIGSSPLALMFIDIDHFKLVNDKYGHSFGDDVLRKIGDVFRENLRSNDISCRYGREEFVVMLPYVGASDAMSIAERIRKSASSARFSAAPDFTFTVSGGVYQGMPAEDEGLADFIKKADAALYVAKADGRNMIVMHSD